MGVLDLSVLFAGVSAAAAVVQAIQAALETRRHLTANEVGDIVSKAEHDASDPMRATKAASGIELDADVAHVMAGKLKEAKDRFLGDMSNAQTGTERSRVADSYRADTCSILRQLKQVNGGVLSDEWYDLWEKLGCS